MHILMVTAIVPEIDRPALAVQRLEFAEPAGKAPKTAAEKEQAYTAWCRLVAETAEYLRATLGAKTAVRDGVQKWLHEAKTGDTLLVTDAFGARDKHKQDVVTLTLLTDAPSLSRISVEEVQTVTTKTTLDKIPDNVKKPGKTKKKATAGRTRLADDET